MLKFGFFILMVSTVSFSSTVAQAAQDCESLNVAYERYNNASGYFDRVSKSETSTLRAETAQSALTNILIRQSMVLDMIIASGCEIPKPPEFLMLGLISSHN